MSRAIFKKQKKFDINSKLLLEIAWEEMPCLENTWRINRCNDIVIKDKNYLLSKLVNNDQDSIKLRK